jgi:hypothetical protein
MYNFFFKLHVQQFTVISCAINKFQESVISAVLKLCLKSLQEFVRLQTFNRSGFQQIQLDMEFLKSSLKEFIDDEAAISFLLKEVRYHLTLITGFCMESIQANLVCLFLHITPTCNSVFM